jgi:hypothetical protein
MPTMADEWKEFQLTKDIPNTRAQTSIGAAIQGWRRGIIFATSFLQFGLFNTL